MSKNLSACAAVLASMALAGCGSKAEDTEAPTSSAPLERTLLRKADGKVLASCGPQAGHAYYAHMGMVPDDKSGWDEDRVSAGGTALIAKADGIFDLMFIDSTEEIYSAVEDGGTVTRHRSGPSEMTFVVAYPENTIEIYQWLKIATGEFRMVQLQSKADPIYKGGVLMARCSFIDFNGA